MRWREKNFDKWVAYGLLLIGVFVFQSTMGDVLAIGKIKPNLLICALVALAMQEGELAGGVFGLVSGFLIDSLLAHISGFFLLLGLVFGVAVGLMTKLFVNVTILSSICMGGAVCFCYNFIIFYTHYFIGGEASILTALLKNILPETIFTAMMMIPFYFLTRYLKQLTTEKEEEAAE